MGRASSAEPIRVLVLVRKGASSIFATALAAGSWAMVSGCTQDFGSFEVNAVDGVDGGSSPHDAAAEGGATGDGPCPQSSCLSTAMSCAAACSQTAMQCTKMCKNNVCRQGCQTSESVCKAPCVTNCTKCVTSDGCSDGSACKAASM